jgi:hypothetical protein
MATEIQRRKMALIERYRSLPLRRRIALVAASFARGRALLLAAMLAVLVFCFSSATAV